MIESILIFSSIAFALGIILSYCSDKFKVKVNPNIRKIYDALPHVDCGGCGYIGCREFAKALATNKEKPGKCMVADKKAIEKIAGIMGIAAEKNDRKVAFVRCIAGPESSGKKFKYSGIKDCFAVSDLHGGDKECSYGCLGYGSCVDVCMFNAIKIGADGVAIVDPDKCVGCGKCVEACPRGIIVIRGENDRVDVACMNGDSGKNTVKVCKDGCIGCGKCEQVCRFGAIKVVDGLARIDHSLCKNCGACVNVCPRHVISIEKTWKGKKVLCVRDSKKDMDCSNCRLCRTG